MPWRKFEVAVHGGPKVAAPDGLVLSLDAGNLKGFDDDENLALNSEAINSWANNGNAISISANSQIAPNGTLTADVLSQTAVTGASRWVSSMTRTYTAGVTYTLSIWLKKISGTDSQPTINLWVNGGTNQSVGTITTEWVRYSKSFTPASTISSNTFTGLNTGWNDTGAANNFTFAAWGFQVETSSSASPYYATAGSIKNRGTTLIDMTGRGNTGTLTNGPTYSSANGGSLVFDGVDDYVTLPTNLLIHETGNPFTFSIWFKTSSTGIILGQTNTSNPTAAAGYVPAIYVGTNGLLYTSCFWGGATSNKSVSSSSVNNGSWNNITVTFASNSQISYLNGVSYATLSKTQTQYTLTYYYFLGSGKGVNWTNFPASPYCNGNISNAVYYNRALTAQEIQQNFNALRGRFGI